MLVSASSGAAAVRFATADVLEKYVAGSPLQRTTVSPGAALEESFFLGLRLYRGVDLREIAVTFGQQALENVRPAIAGLVADELMEQHGDFIRLTARGRLLSNEVFQAFLAPAHVSAKI
jgi:oxygen-independent coproporphyrinogen III oxidase